MMIFLRNDLLVLVSSESRFEMLMKDLRGSKTSIRIAISKRSNSKIKYLSLLRKVLSLRFIFLLAHRRSTIDNGVRNERVADIATPQTQ